MLAATFKHWNASFEWSPCQPYHGSGWSPSHRNDRIMHDIVLVTESTFLPCCTGLSFRPHWWTLESSGLCICRATGQFWPSSSTSQRSLSLWLECTFLLQPDDGQVMAPYILTTVPILFIWASIQSCCPYSAYRMLLLFFCISFEQVCTDTSSVSEQERQSWEAVSKSESAMFPLD